MEKKSYDKPIIEVIELKQEDIIMASNEYDPNGLLDDDAYGWHW